MPRTLLRNCATELSKFNANVVNAGANDAKKIKKAEETPLFCIQVLCSFFRSVLSDEPISLVPSEYFIA